MIPMIPGCRGQIGVKNTLYETSKGGVAVVFYHVCRPFTYRKKEVTFHMEHNFHDYHRGEVYYADLNPVFGHEQGGSRPAHGRTRGLSRRSKPRRGGNRENCVPYEKLPPFSDM